jgi:hypothetical protein
MDRQNSLSIGTKWFFSSAIMVLATFLILTADNSRATQMNEDIATASAWEISSQEISKEKLADQDFDQEKLYVNLEDQQLTALGNQNQAPQIQISDAQRSARLEFQENIHSTVLFGLRVVGISLGLGVFIASILGGMGLNRYLTAKTQTKDNLPSNGKLYVKIQYVTHQVHTPQENISAMEQFKHHRATQTDIDNSTPIWPTSNDDLKSDKYHWIN